MGGWVKVSACEKPHLERNGQENGNARQILVDECDDNGR